MKRPQPWRHVLLAASAILLSADYCSPAVAFAFQQDAQTGKDPQQQLQELVSRRLELVAELRMKQAAGVDDQQILPTAIALHGTEVQLIALAEKSADVDPAELAAMRTMHIDLLSWLADAFEKSNLDAALAARQDGVKQLQILHGPEHWKTQTMQMHVERVKWMQQMSPDDLRDARQAAEKQIEGTVLAAAGQLREALAAQSFALNARMRCFGPDHWLTARSMNEVGLLVAQLGDLQNAEKLYRGAASIYFNTLGPDHPALATLLANLADVLRQLSKLDDAVVFQEEAIRLFALLDEGRGPQSAQAINHLGMIRLDQGAIQAAHDLAMKAEDILEELDRQGGSATRQSQAMVASNLAAIALKRGKLAEAQEYAESAVEIIEDEFGPDHPYVAQLCNNLGHILMEQAEYEAADEQFVRALEIYSAYELTNINMAAALMNRGDLRRMQGQAGEARQMLTAAVSMIEQSVQMQHPDSAGALNLLALVEIEQGHFETAAEHLANAAEITRATLGEQHPRYLTVLENSIKLANAQRNRREVKQLVHQAANVALQIFGEHNPEYAEHLSQLGQFAADAQEYGLAESLLVNGTELLKQELGKKHPEYAEAATRLGRVYVATQEAERGEALLQEGLNILGETLGQEHPKYAKALNSLGEAYTVLQNLDDAETTLRAGTDVLARKLGKKHPEYGIAVRELAELYLSKGEGQRSKALITESADILSNALGVRHPEYAETLQTMASVYSLLQEPDLAAKLRDESADILQDLAEEQIRAGQQRLWQKLNQEVR